MKMDHTHIKSVTDAVFHVPMFTLNPDAELKTCICTYICVWLSAYR